MNLPGNTYVIAKTYKKVDWDCFPFGCPAQCGTSSEIGFNLMGFDLNQEARRYRFDYIPKENAEISQCREDYRAVSSFGNYTINVILNNNCSAGDYRNRVLVQNLSVISPIRYSQDVIQVTCSPAVSNNGPWIHCVPEVIRLTKNDLNHDESFNVRDDIVVYNPGGLGSDTASTITRNRTVILPLIYDVNYTEVYNADWCVQRYILRCDE